MSLSKILGLVGIMSEMLVGSYSGFTVSDRAHRYIARRMHTTKTGPGRSEGMQPAIRAVGSKIARHAREGRLGLRGRTLSGASALAQQNKIHVL